MLYALATRPTLAQTVYPTGTTIYDPDKSWNGFTVLSPLGTPAVLVIDMNGNVVKRWEDVNNSAGGPARVLPGGIVMSASGARPPHQESLALIRRDFDGKDLWQFSRSEQIPTREGGMVWSARQHHDWQLDSFPAGYYSPESTPNANSGNTLILTHTDRMQPKVADVMLGDDRLIEVSSKGEIVWDWVASDHIDELGFAPDARSAIKAARSFNKPRGSYDWLHVNSATYVGPNQWFDKGDMRFAPNNVIISSREASLLAIVGRDGKIVWRLGPDFSASKELRAIRQIIGQHHAHLIPKGLPGAGNLLVFDNGGSSGYGFANPIAPDGVGAFARATSRVLEINPVTLELVWSYTNPRFFSTNISSAQRLANGNTLITAGAGGRLFEVTKEGAIVWEYMFPMFAGAGPNPSNAVYRAYRIPYGWIPQLTKPTEQRLTPPALGEFRVSASSARSQSLAAADCTAERLGTSVAPSAIGEPVRSVTLSAPSWVEASNGVPAHCRVNGSMASIDTASTARPINFSVVLPASWSRHAAQLGGGGMNGIVPNLTGGGPGAQGPSLLDRGFATYGSDSGHQAAFGARGGAGRGGAPGANVSDDWTLNEEAIRNLGYAQMKKTHDAAMVIIERAYGERPRFNYYIGTSQGGREALTVAQRYPADYDGIAANVPIVSFSTLMLAPELIRIREKPQANWVTPAKVNAIRGEFMRQCDGLDGLADGIINNYMACRAIFDVTQGARNRRPWAAKRCPNNVDPNPEDTSANACLTDGQISTLAVHLCAVLVRDAARPRHAIVRHVGAQYRSVRQRPDSERAVSWTGRCRGGRTDARASRRPRRDWIPDEESVGEPARLRRRRRVQSPPRRALGDPRRDQPRPLSVSEARGQDDRHHWYERHARIAGRTVGLLPIGARSDGPRHCRWLRALVRDAADRTRVERHQLRCGRRGAYDCVAPRSQSLRPARTALRLGRERQGARRCRSR